jgi:hypothetical protein
MDHERLRNDLRKLHGELRVIKTVDASEEQLLRQLETDIEVLLSGDDDQLRPDPASLERLSRALTHVEASHPRVTLLMRQMVDSLAYLGV